MTIINEKKNGSLASAVGFNQRTLVVGPASFVYRPHIFKKRKQKKKKKKKTTGTNGIIKINIYTHRGKKQGEGVSEKAKGI